MATSDTLYWTPKRFTLKVGPLYVTFTGGMKNGYYGKRAMTLTADANFAAIFSPATGSSHHGAFQYLKVECKALKKGGKAETLTGTLGNANGDRETTLQVGLFGDGHSVP